MGKKSLLILVQIVEEVLVEEIKDRISGLKDRIKEMSKEEKKYKNADETLNIIKKILDYNKDVQKKFQLTTKVH